MTLDLPGRHASRVHGDDLLVEARKPPLIPGDQLRVERAFPIARNTQVQLGILGQHRLLRIAIAVIGLARRRLAIEMVVQFRVQDALGQRFLQLVEKPILGKHLLRIAPDKSSSNVPFLIAIARLLRLHYGPTHKIPDSPPKAPSAATADANLFMRLPHTDTLRLMTVQASSCSRLS